MNDLCGGRNTIVRCTAAEDRRLWTRRGRPPPAAGLGVKTAASARHSAAPAPAPAA